jgi:hypothetical protein
MIALRALRACDHRNRSTDKMSSVCSVVLTMKVSGSRPATTLLSGASGVYSSLIACRAYSPPRELPTTLIYCNITTAVKSMIS